MYFSNFCLTINKFIVYLLEHGNLFNLAQNKYIYFFNKNAYSFSVPSIPGFNASAVKLMIKFTFILKTILFV